MMKFFKSILLAALLFSFSCSPQITSAEGSSESQPGHEKPSLEGTETAVFASGCFWCVEAIFQSLKGVPEAVSGYAGGDEENPTYEQVSSGRTGHAESVQVYYDPKVISYGDLLKVFFGSHDPTQLNGQGPDVGTQYRSAIFYENDEQKRQAEAYVRKLEEEKAFRKPITTEISPLKKFYKAEDYHQEYEELHPDNPYVRNVSEPRLHAFQKKFPELLKVGH